MNAHGARCGQLLLNAGKTVEETDKLTRRGEYDFVYANHIVFTDENLQARYGVVARPNEDAIRGQVIVAEEPERAETRGGRIAAEVVERVRGLLPIMDDSSEGLTVLKPGADVIHQPPPYGFRHTTNRQYDNYRMFYKTFIAKDTTR